MYSSRNFLFLTLFRWFVWLMAVHYQIKAFESWSITNPWCWHAGNQWIRRTKGPGYGLLINGTVICIDVTRAIGCQDSSINDGRQGDMPYWITPTYLPPLPSSHTFVVPRHPEICGPFALPGRRPTVIRDLHIRFKVFLFADAVPSVGPTPAAQCYEISLIPIKRTV